jgi:hypothetical protein
LYPQYFPLMALAKYQAHARARSAAAARNGSAHCNGKSISR